MFNFKFTLFLKGGGPSIEHFQSLILGVPDFFKFYVAEIYRHCLERVDCAKSLTVDRTHLVLVSGKLALKNFSSEENTDTVGLV